MSMTDAHMIVSMSQGLSVCLGRRIRLLFARKDAAMGARLTMRVTTEM